jgi:hypothetical protein
VLLALFAIYSTRLKTNWGKIGFYNAGVLFIPAISCFVNLITDKMLASNAHRPAAAPLKTLKGTSARYGADHKMISANSGISFQTISKAEPQVITKNALSSSKIFPITFSYLQKLCYTKVLKVAYRADEFIYKVVLRSQVSSGTGICWMQLRTEGWAVLLGHGLDESLISAITLAIESQE